MRENGCVAEIRLPHYCPPFLDMFAKVAEMSPPKSQKGVQSRIV